MHFLCCCYCSVTKSCLTQHARLPCPSPSPGACSSSCPLSWRCYLTISSSVSPLLLLPSIFPSIKVFSNESALCIRGPKYWSFSISPSNEYSGLISFRIGWFDFLLVQGTLSRVFSWLHSYTTSNYSLNMQCPLYFYGSSPYFLTLYFSISSHHWNGLRINS